MSLLFNGCAVRNAIPYRLQTISATPAAKIFRNLPLTKQGRTPSMCNMNSGATHNGYESFLIPTQRVEELTARIAKLNKRAIKLGTPAIDLIVTDNTSFNTIKVGGAMALRMGTEYGYETTEVLIKGETPKLNGWEFLSVVLHRPAGNEFVNATGDVDLSEFIFTDKKCDHCNINRPRNATFLVKHEDGTIKQVGSSCLEAYTGVKSPQAHAKQLENIFDMFKELRGGWGATEGRTTKRFFLAEWMAFVNMVVQDAGHYVSRNRSYDTGEQTTGDLAKAMIIQASNNPDAQVPADEDWTLAQAQIDWIRTEEAHDHILAFSAEYGKQLLAATKSNDGDAVSEDTMKIIAPLAAFYKRYMDDLNKPKSMHVGNPGDTLTMTVKCVYAAYDQDYGYGPTNVFSFRDEVGNMFGTMTKSKKCYMESGKSYTIEGKVKKHTHYKGEEKTDMNFVKVVCEA